MSKNEVGVWEDGRMKLRKRASRRTWEVPLDLWTPHSPSIIHILPISLLRSLRKTEDLARQGNCNKTEEISSDTQGWGHGEDWMLFYTVEQGLANYGLLPLLIWSANQEWFVHSQMVGGGGGEEMSMNKVLLEQGRAHLFKYVYGCIQATLAD